jgi:hypothetical protein
MSNDERFEAMRTLWQTVVYTAVRDAVMRSKSPDGRKADAWIRSGAYPKSVAGKWFRHVCTITGMDPDFIMEAYVSGRITKDGLSKSTKGVKPRGTE